MRRVVILAVVLAALPACNVELPQRQEELEAVEAVGGNPTRGREAIRRYGCTSCHTIPGLPGDANVGPSLQRIGGRVYVAGVLVNTPENLCRWIQNAPAVDPKTAMPNVGVTDEDVKDIASYLYTLR